MYNLDLPTKVQQFRSDVDIAHRVVHGDDKTVVETEGGPVRSLAKLIADNAFDFNTVNATLENHETRITKLESGKEDLHQHIVLIEPAGEHTVDAVYTKDFSTVKWIVEVTNPLPTAMFRQVFEVTATHDGGFDISKNPASDVSYSAFGKVVIGEPSVRATLLVGLVPSTDDSGSMMVLALEANAVCLVKVTRQETFSMVDPAPFLVGMVFDTWYKVTVQTCRSDGTMLGVTEGLHCGIVGLDDTLTETGTIVTTTPNDPGIAWTVTHYSSGGDLVETKTFDMSGLVGYDDTLYAEAQAVISSMADMLYAIPDNDPVIVTNHGNVRDVMRDDGVLDTLCAALKHVGATSDALFYLDKIGLSYLLLGKGNTANDTAYNVPDIMYQGYTRYGDFPPNDFGTLREFVEFSVAPELAVAFQIKNGDYELQYLPLEYRTVGYEVLSIGSDPALSWGGANSGWNGPTSSLLYHGSFQVSPIYGGGTSSPQMGWNIVTFHPDGTIAKLDFVVVGGSDGQSWMQNLSDRLNAIPDDTLIMLYGLGDTGAEPDTESADALSAALGRFGASGVTGQDFLSLFASSHPYILYGKAGIGVNSTDALVDPNQASEYSSTYSAFLRHEFYIQHGKFYIDRQYETQIM